jgi:hypothetical protein
LHDSDSEAQCKPSFPDTRASFKTFDLMSQRHDLRPEPVGQQRGIGCWLRHKHRRSSDSVCGPEQRHGLPKVSENSQQSAPLQTESRGDSHSRPLWIAIGLIGLAALVYLHLSGRPHHLLTFHPNADKIEHVFAFGGAMLWFGQLYRRGMERTFFCFCLILAGVSLEYAQHALGHFDPVEYGDMAADALGAILGFLVSSTRLGTIRG